MFPDRSKNDGAFVNGTGELQYCDLRGWASAPASAAEPFMTLYDKISHESLTLGSISPWASPPQQFVVHNADDEWGTMGMVVAPVTIAPGKEVGWKLVLAFHKAPEQGAGIYQDAVCLKCIYDILTGIPVLVLNIKRTTVKIQPHEHRLASLPYIRNIFCFRNLRFFNERKEGFLTHSMSVGAGIFLTGSSIETVIAEKVTVIRGGFYK